MDLSIVSTDDLVSEMQKRLDRGEIGYEGLYSHWQANYRDAWHELNIWIWARLNAGEFDRYSPVSAKMAECLDSAPRAPAPKTVNTTLYGREHELA